MRTRMGVLLSHTFRSFAPFASSWATDQHEIYRWGVEHGVLVLCTVATAGALGNMYYKKKNDIPYKVKLVKDPDGFNDVISYAVYHLYQFKRKHFPSDPDLQRGPHCRQSSVKNSCKVI